MVDILNDWKTVRRHDLESHFQESITVEERTGTMVHNGGKVTVRCIKVFYSDKPSTAIEKIADFGSFEQDLMLVKSLIRNFNCV